jgi:hypothetical protein
MFYLPIPIFLARSIPYMIRGKRDQQVLLKEMNRNHIQNSLSGKMINLMDSFELGYLDTFGRLPIGGSCIAVLQTK